ncbi:HPr family phosphocarrier protein [Bacillus shivajii]|uniref:HPr family phosphocarrier protein n=1 Tax=Bacillus shivajii TaxID=1983719 RepID=UPI001CF97520|nr:HPr family phosphocarrier protein [Bacillus shivajii]UCZ51531.1 HPr family phosphocarrier protein [Bacillus shivajii]
MERNTVLNIQTERVSFQEVIEFVQLNRSFKSQVYINKHNQQFNGNSITSMMRVLLTAKVGEHFIVNVIGEHADSEIIDIIKLLEKTVSFN